ncbi:MAG TPA: MFS transporter [Burkholderiales bacterium]|jgi:predicted MFS family arabinose efflux permease|nr:MFS transporter [Burkholderiales bacterium]
MNSAFFALAAAAFVSGANLRLFDALLPTVAADFLVPVTTASVVVTAFTLAYGLFQIVHGPLGDRVGKLRTVGGAVLIAAAASLGCAFAPSLHALTLLRFATGIGAAAIVPLSLAWIGDNTPYEKRQATLGRFLGFVLLGQILGPAFGGALAEFVSWREVFYALAAVFLAVGLVLFSEDRKARRAPMPARIPTGVLRAYSDVLRDRWVRTVMLTVFLEGSLFYGAFAYGGAYLKERFDLSYLVIGALLAGFGLGGVIYSLLVRRLLARLQEKGFVQTGGLILFVCFLVLALLPGWLASVPIFIASGFGFYMFHNTLQTKATEMAPQARGTAIAVFAFSLFMGQASGVAAYGLLISAVGYRWAFMLAAFGLLALALWFARRVSSHRK